MSEHRYRPTHTERLRPRFDPEAERAGVAMADWETRIASLERRPLGIRTLYAIFDAGTVALTTGVKGDVPVHHEFEIYSWMLLASVSGSIVVDIWKDTYANYPPVVGDSITGSAKPTISSGVKGTSATLTGWNTSLVAGDCLRFNIDSVTTITRCTLALELRPSGPTLM